MKDAVNSIIRRNCPGDKVLKSRKQRWAYNWRIGSRLTLSILCLVGRNVIKNRQAEVAVLKSLPDHARGQASKRPAMQEK